MACVSVSVTIPVPNIPGITIGITPPALALDVDFCCRISVGPWPQLGSIGVSSATITAPAYKVIATAIAGIQAWVNQVTQYLNIPCPLQ